MQNVAHWVFIREIVAHQEHKGNRVQLDHLALQAQMVFLVLMDNLELQEEMVHKDCLVHKDNEVSLDQMVLQDHQELLEPQEGKENQA